MGNLSRGEAMRASRGMVAKPFVTTAAANTATVRLERAFVQNKDVALGDVVAVYQKVSGNTIDLSKNVHSDTIVCKAQTTRGWSASPLS